jgi:hypothetical protein
VGYLGIESGGGAQTGVSVPLPGYLRIESGGGAQTGVSVPLPTSGSGTVSIFARWYNLGHRWASSKQSGRRLL